ncbi:MAG: flavin reductase [Anaerovoracaceae bacterium]|nr:flavin reductase [Bacillota bacterium]MDY2671102.1 flavin reductase [Anaerovoracaceae bacterium]
MNKKVTRNFTYGLFVVTARDGDKLNGCIINTAIQAASEPLTVAISVNKANYTHDMIQKTGEFNLSFLSEDSKFSTFEHFGFQSGRDVDKFEKFSYKLSENGLPYITEGANAFLSAKVTKTVDLGSHTMFIGEITDGEVLNDTASVSYSYYFANIKPKPEKKEESEKQVGWICTICGYIYPHEELPEDFICPICKHPASDFKKL